MIGAGGVKAEQAALAHDLADSVKLFDRDEVEVGRAVDARQGLRLVQHQRLRLACALLHAFGQAREALGKLLVALVAQDA